VAIGGRTARDGMEVVERRCGLDRAVKWNNWNAVTPYYFSSRRRDEPYFEFNRDSTTLKTLLPKVLGQL